MIWALFMFNDQIESLFAYVFGARTVDYALLLENYVSCHQQILGKCSITMLTVLGNDMCLYQA